MDGQTGSWTDGWVDKWIDRFTIGQTDKRSCHCAPQAGVLTTVRLVVQLVGVGWGGGGIPSSLIPKRITHTRQW